MLYCESCEKEFTTTYVYKDFKLLNEKTGYGMNWDLNHPRVKRIKDKITYVYPFCTYCKGTEEEIDEIEKKITEVIDKKDKKDRKKT